MARVVLRVRLTNGDHLDVAYEDASATDEAALVEKVITTLADDGGVVRAAHGGRPLILYGRGVAAIEIGPRGAVL